jgi:hypothetical protein
MCCQAMIDQVTFGASGTASASGLSRFNRFRGLIVTRQGIAWQCPERGASSVPVRSRCGRPVCGSKDGPAHCADAGNIAQTPKFSVRPFSGIFNALSGSGQPNQQIGDLFVLVAQERAVTIAGLTHAKGAAGQRNTDTVSRHHVLGQTPAQALSVNARIHLPGNRWPDHFFPRASFSNSACMLISAYVVRGKRPTGAFSDPFNS